MQIEVKRKHIKAGNRLMCETCPVALAINEATGSLWRVGIACVNLIHTAKDPYIDHLVSIHLPTAVRKWIRDFDLGGKVGMKPITFEFDYVPSPILPPAPDARLPGPAAPPCRPGGGGVLNPGGPGGRQNECRA